MLLISDTSQISYSEIQQAFVFSMFLFCFDVFHKARKELVRITENVSNFKHVANS